jgi:TolB-like protein/Flp pilus assembly protein TadD
VSFIAELKRRNVFRVAIAYLALAWLLTEVAGTLFPSFGIPEWAFRFVVIMLALGFVPVLIFSWAYEITPEGLKREIEVVRDDSILHLTAKRLDTLTISLIIVALAFIVIDRLWLREKITKQVKLPPIAVSAPEQKAKPESVQLQFPPNSIAVLPFVNMSSDAEQEYFSDGISEELLNLLAKVPELQVIARTSSFAFKGKETKIADVAKELNVSHVLEGSVRKSGNRVRITAQLIRSEDSVHLWSETYDRTLDDIFAIQDEIATAVVSGLKVAMLGEATPQVTTTNPEAYALFLQSRHVSNRYTKEAYARAESLLNKSLAIDPGFAPAWRELGEIYSAQEDFGRPLDEARALAKSAFQKALELDPDYAPVFASLSLLARRDIDFVTADQHLKQAMKLNRNSAFPFGAAASLSRTFGRFDQSIELAQNAISVNPVSSSGYANLGYSQYYAGRLDEASSSFRKSISLNPDRFRAYFYLGRVLLAQGELQEAYVEIQKVTDDAFQLAGLAMAYHALGDTLASDQAATRLSENWGETAAFQIAEVYAYRGQMDLAIMWLRKAHNSRDAGLAILLGNPVFKTLESDVRYRSLVEKLDLLPYWQEMNQVQSRR